MKQKNILLIMLNLLLLSGVMFSFQACSDVEPGEDLMPPTLQTVSALNIARTSVTVKGSVSGGLNAVQECGVKYSTSKEFPADKTGKVIYLREAYKMKRLMEEYAAYLRKAAKSYRDTQNERATLARQLRN
jgi:hypothetical protein